MLLAGPKAAGAGRQAFCHSACGWKRSASSFGQASAIKMLRSVLIKGMEALIAGIAVCGRPSSALPTACWPSLAGTYPGMDWPKVSDYLVGRTAPAWRRVASLRCARVRAPLCVIWGHEPLMAESHRQPDRRLRQRPLGGHRWDKTPKRGGSLRRKSNAAAHAGRPPEFRVAGD